MEKIESLIFVGGYIARESFFGRTLSSQLISNALVILDFSQHNAQPRVVSNDLRSKQDVIINTYWANFNDFLP